MSKYYLTDFLVEPRYSHFSDSLRLLGRHLFQAIKECLEGALSPYWQYLRVCTERNIFIVGGALRNLALMKPVKDWDLLVDCNDPNEVRLLSRQFCDFAKASWVVLDKERGFYRAVFTQINVEIDFCTRQGKNILEDLQERDFTVNALAYSLKDGALYDVGSGLADIGNHKLAIVSPHSLTNDPLRALRAVRFCLAHSLTIDAQLESKIAHFLRSGLKNIAGERIAAELSIILNQTLADRKLQLQRTALDSFLDQEWDSKRIFPETALSCWELLTGLEEQQKLAWPLFKHSGRLLQSKLEESPKGGRNYLSLLKLAFLAKFDLLTPQNNRFKLSGAELQVIRETKTASEELAKLLIKPPDRREFYRFFGKVKYFFIIASVNGIWLSSLIKTFSITKGASAKATFVGAGKKAQMENNQGGAFSAGKYASWALYLDCLLLDYLKGGTLSKPLVPIDGCLLQRKLGIEPGPGLGKILRELAEECSLLSMSEEEALSWVKDRLSRDVAS